MELYLLNTHNIDWNYGIFHFAKKPETGYPKPNLE